MIIDGHAHACGDFLRADRIVELLHNNKVDKVILVPGELESTKNYSLPMVGEKFPETDIIFYTNVITKIMIKLTGLAKQIDFGNTYVYAITKEYPDKLIQFYWLKLSDPKALEKLTISYDIFQFKGIKLHQCWESFKVESQRFHELTEWAASKNLPIFIHLFSKSQAAILARYINDHRKTNFIIAHLFALEEYINTEINTDNIFFDISSCYLLSKQRMYKAIKHFGVERIIFGSDTPYGKNALEFNIKSIQSLDISDREKELILGENIKAIVDFEAS